MQVSLLAVQEKFIVGFVNLLCLHKGLTDADLSFVVVELNALIRCM